MPTPSLPSPRDLALTALMGLFERTGIAGWLAAAVVLPWLLIGQLTPAISVPPLLLAAIYASGLRPRDATDQRTSLIGWRTSICSAHPEDASAART